MRMREEKKRLRAAVRKRRALMSEKEKYDASKRLTQRILDVCRSYEAVALYYSVANEPSTHEAINLLYSQGKRVLLPHMTQMLPPQWAWFEGSDSLVSTHGGVHYPEGTPMQLPDVSVDIMIVPALLVNEKGVRLGQGGGWYDRSLARLTSHIPIYACVYEQEYIQEDIPMDVFDKRVDGVLCV
ncbi:MAG: 5-formyltetrahydrofolate cyclo-ligase [Actinomycetaceae bacterium]|nr:5-formyltetrahydrofolate cyclo-ligase [Actinomycetaceae bacterium]